ncbi:Hypothetical protein KVN_LOCUS32 [uncultured virus]|nr:Hypothetical protein KVN_LOCUS32 [uncultured virus]
MVLVKIAIACINFVHIAIHELIIILIIALIVQLYFLIINLLDHTTIILIKLVAYVTIVHIKHINIDAKNAIGMVHIEPEIAHIDLFIKKLKFKHIYV